MPGPESPSPRGGEGEAKPPRPCERLGAVAAAAAAAPFPSGPSFSRLLRRARARSAIHPRRTRPDAFPVPEHPFPTFPVPDRSGPWAGFRPPRGCSPGTGRRRSCPEGTSCAPAAAGRARARRIRVRTIPRTPSIYGSPAEGLTAGVRIEVGGAYQSLPWRRLLRVHVPREGRSAGSAGCPLLAELAGYRERLGPILASTVLPFALVVYLALEGGGYDVVVRSEVGMALWWIVLLGALVGVLPVRPLGRAEQVGLGLLLAFAAWTALGISWSESSERSVEEVARVLTFARGAGAVALGAGSRGAAEDRSRGRRGDRPGRRPCPALAPRALLVPRERAGILPALR